jgi:hypothetical protein
MKINKDHEKVLADSCINYSIADSAGLRSVTEEEAFKLMGFRVKGLFIPYSFLDGVEDEFEYGRLRKDFVRKGCAKYLQSACYSLPLYFIKSEKRHILDLSSPLFIVEGEKKLLSHISNTMYEVDYFDAATVALPGCWNFQEKLEDGTRQFKGDWKKIPMLGRDIHIIPDTDYFFNPKVGKAYNTLIQMCLEAGAVVSVHDLRIDDTTRLGLDDFIYRYGQRAYLDKLNEEPIIKLRGFYE